MFWRFFEVFEQSLTQPALQLKFLPPVPIPSVIIRAQPIKPMLVTGERRACEYQNKSASSIRNVSNETFHHYIGSSHEGLLHQANALVVEEPMMGSWL
jgi:hypothetical protein